MHGLIRRLRGGVVLLALAAGCSSKPQMAQLSGTVTFKGQPVPAGWISFTPEAGKGSVKVCQIKDGVYDSSKEPDPGIFPGRNLIRIGGFDGKKIPYWGQGKQIFNPVDDAIDVPTGASTRDFVIPESAGKDLKIQPTADE
ncbi:MAG TPA: hypothetical protein VKE40_10270 [Gemmataceae bacterium]|nr:hypothetical protein [Gemmataceae bacterium]